MLVITLTSFAVVREREIGTLEQIMVTPIRPVEFILGKTLPFFLIGLFDALLIAIVGTFWFQVPFRGHILVLLTGAVLFLILHAGRGAAYLHRLVDAAAGHGHVVLLHHARHHFFRIWIPHQHHAAVDAVFTYLIPLRYFLVVLRGTYLKGVGMDVLWPQMAAMACFGLGLLTVADSALPQGAGLDASLPALSS